MTERQFCLLEVIKQCNQVRSPIVFIDSHPLITKTYEQPSLDSPPRYTGSMILLVEDDAASRYAFARLLRGEGYEVIEAGDGNEAVAFLDGFPVDLVITDMVLPKINGLHLISLIHARRPGIPIVLMSGYLSERAGKIILDGAADFFRSRSDHRH